MIIPIPRELTVATVAENRALWLSLLKDAPDEIQFDGSGVMEMDGAGLQLLMAISNGQVTSGKSMSVMSPSSTLQRVFVTMGWIPTVDAEPTRS